MAEFDVIIVGGGPGGYIAAERLAQGGKTVLLIEESSLGGTCLNVGCIPTKAWLNSAKEYDHARRSSMVGIHAESVTYDWGQIQDWKAKTVATLVGGVAQMMKKLKVLVIQGHAQMLSATSVQVGDEIHQGTDVILATGSVPVTPPIPGIDNNPAILDSTGLLAIDHVPNKLTIVGAGAIGVEFASVFSRLGTSVTVIEMMDEILPFMDPEVAGRIRSSMPDVDFRLSATVESFDNASVTYSMDGQPRTVDADCVLMAVGRRPAVDGWGIDQTGIAYSNAGIEVDDTMSTSVPHVWAVGDVTGKSLLAHAAYRMGEIAAARILDPDAGAKGQKMRWDTVPWALYSAPEAAGVGLTQAECAKRGIETICSSVPLVLSGRFVAENGLSRAGVVKVVAEAGSRVIRGVQVVGSYAPEMIWGAAGILEMEFTIEDVQQLVFPHPSVSEGIREAVWAFPKQGSGRK